MESVSPSQTYGSFFIGDNEFALSVKNVQEVVNAPQTYTKIPLASKDLLGMFNLRGMIVPVMDLRSVMNLPTHNIPSEQKKIAILDCGHFCIGLLFDQTGEIFKSQNDQKSDFQADSSDPIGRVVSGAFKMDEGRRIVQILNTQALLELGHIPQEMKTDASRSRQSLEKKNRGLRKQCISFAIGSANCALNIDSIQEILKVDKIRKSSLAVDQCIGIIDIRGQVIPVIDFGAMLGYREPDHTETAIEGERRILVMRLGSEVVGLLVDSIDSIVPYFKEDVLPFPSMNTARQNLFEGCISMSDRKDILLLNPKEILSDSELAAITHGHSKLYHSEKSSDDKKNQKGNRKTYITFSLDHLFAAEIGEIQEIVDCPEQLLHPPGLPDSIQGVYNLRGNMVAIIDSRKLYGLKEKAVAFRKVIIFEKDQNKYGLIVDSVDSILSFSDQDKIKIPEVLYRNCSDTYQNDVSQAMQVDLGTGKKETLLILNIKGIADRLVSKKVS